MSDAVVFNVQTILTTYNFMISVVEYQEIFKYRYLRTVH